ncbi:MAG: YggT family protein [Lactobacillus sp.]|nr:YggT family protein [Lactobacillus sp.]
MIFKIIFGIDWILWIYSIIIVIDAILSWVPILAQSFVGRLIHAIVEPYLSLFRVGPIAKFTMSTGVDFSSMIGLFVIYIAQKLITDILLRLS